MTRPIPDSKITVIMYDNDGKPQTVLKNNARDHLRLGWSYSQQKPKPKPKKVKPKKPKAPPPKPVALSFEERMARQRAVSAKEKNELVAKARREGKEYDRDWSLAKLRDKVGAA